MAQAPARRSPTRGPSCALGPPHPPGKLARSWGAPRPLIWAQGWALRLCRAPSRAPRKEGGAQGGCWASPWGGRCGCQGAAGWVVPAGHSSWSCGDSWDGQEEQKTPSDPRHHGVPGLDALSTMKQALASAPGCGPARPPTLPGKPAGQEALRDAGGGGGASRFLCQQGQGRATSRLWGLQELLGLSMPCWVPESPKGKGRGLAGVAAGGPTERETLRVWGPVPNLVLGIRLTLGPC